MAGVAKLLVHMIDFRLKNLLAIDHDLQFGHSCYMSYDSYTIFASRFVPMTFVFSSAQGPIT